MNTTERTPDDEEMTDDEMLAMILQSPGTLTLWDVKGDRPQLVAKIPIPKRRTKTKRRTRP